MTSTTVPTPTPTPASAIHGVVRDGPNPIAGAHLYLFAANTTGYGQPSVSLLSASSTGASDAVGAYVVSDSGGSFSMPVFTCAGNAQVYIYALGGNAGGGINAAAGLMAALGPCPATGTFLPSLPTVAVNEVTTVATAYALAGFATDAIHISSSGTALAQSGVANASLNAANLASVATGQALSQIPAGTAAAPQMKVNTLANILSACVSSAGPTSANCATLFMNTLANGAMGSSPTDTASAAINMAHNASVNIRPLYGLVTSSAPFAPGLNSAPGDFTLGLTFKGSEFGSPGRIAIDGAGAAWIVNGPSNSIVKLSSSGVLLSGTSGFTGGGISSPFAIALDDSGNAWVTASGGVAELSNSGAALSGASGYTAGGLTGPRQLAVDGGGNVWVTGDGDGVIKLSSAGVPLSGSTVFTASGLTRPDAIAIDAAGDAWVTSFMANNSIFELGNSGSFLSGPNGYALGNALASSSVAVDASTNVWAASNGDLAVKISSSGSTLLIAPGPGSNGIAVDGANNIWVTDISDTVVRGLSNTGSPISGTFGYNGGVLTNPLFLALDGSGDIWVVNETFGNSADEGVSELIGVSVPVVTPIATGVKNNTLGTRP